MNADDSALNKFGDISSSCRIDLVPPHSNEKSSPRRTEKVMTYSYGKLAMFTDASVIATDGETVILTTFVAEKPFSTSDEVIAHDSLPLVVDYHERSSAGRKIPSSIGRREFRQTDFEILVSRLIDRSIRPFFADRVLTECKALRVVNTLFSYDSNTSQNQNSSPVVATADEVMLALNSTFTAVRLGSELEKLRAGTHVHHQWKPSDMFTASLAAVRLGVLSTGDIEVFPDKLAIDVVKGMKPSVKMKQEKNKYVGEVMLVGDGLGGFNIFEATMFTNDFVLSDELLAVAIEVAQGTLNDLIKMQDDFVHKVVESVAGKTALVPAEKENDLAQVSPSVFGIANRRELAAAHQQDLASTTHELWTQLLSLAPDDFISMQDIDAAVTKCLNSRKKNDEAQSDFSVLEKKRESLKRLLSKKALIHNVIIGSMKESPTDLGPRFERHSNMFPVVHGSSAVQCNQEQWWKKQANQSDLTACFKAQHSPIGGEHLHSAVVATVTVGSLDLSAKKTRYIEESANQNLIVHLNVPRFAMGEAGWKNLTRGEVEESALLESIFLKLVPAISLSGLAIRLNLDVTAHNGSYLPLALESGILALVDAGINMTNVISGTTIALYPCDSSSDAVASNRVLGPDDLSPVISPTRLEEELAIGHISLYGLGSGVTQCDFSSKVKLNQQALVSALKNGLADLSARHHDLSTFLQAEGNQKKPQTAQGSLKNERPEMKILALEKKHMEEIFKRSEFKVKQLQKMTNSRLSLFDDLKTAIENDENSLQDLFSSNEEGFKSQVIDHDGKSMDLSETSVEEFASKFDLVRIFFTGNYKEDLEKFLQIIRLKIEPVEIGSIYRQARIVNVNVDRGFAIVELREFGRTGFLGLSNIKRTSLMPHIVVNSVITVQVESFNEEKGSITLKLLEVVDSTGSVMKPMVQPGRQNFSRSGSRPLKEGQVYQNAVVVSVATNGESAMVEVSPGQKVKMLLVETASHLSKEPVLLRAGEKVTCSIHTKKGKPYAKLI